MRPLIATLCTVLVFYGMPVAAETPAVRGGAESVGDERVDASGLERPWPPRPLGVRLVQVEREAPAGDGGEEVDPRIAELMAERAKIDRRWPTAGVIAGTAMTLIGGATLGLTAVFCRRGDWIGPDETNCAGGKVDGAWAAGGLLVGGGLILLATSAPILAKRDAQRRAINRKIRAIERGESARAGSALTFGFDVGERNGLRVAWRY